MSDETVWFYVVEDEEGRRQEGPVSTAELQEMLSSGRVSADTLVWHEGMADWDLIGTVSHFTIPEGPEAAPDLAEMVPEEPPEAAPPVEAAAAQEVSPAEALPTEAAPAAEAVLAETAPVPESAPAEAEPDTVTIRETGTHTVRFSRSRGLLEIAANDPGAGPLALTRLDLLGFLVAMETHGRQGDPA